MSEVIYAYTRAQAIADGVLIDVTETASEVGLGLPTAVTVAVWEQCITNQVWHCCSDEYGRTRSILWLLMQAVEKQQGPFEVEFVVPVRRSDRRVVLRELKAHCGPGDNGEPVMTVMLPNED